MTEKEFIKTEAEIIVNIVLESEDNYEARYAVEDRLQMVINLINLKTSHNEEGEYDDDGEGAAGVGDTAKDIAAEPGEGDGAAEHLSVAGQHTFGVVSSGHGRGHAGDRSRIARSPTLATTGEAIRLCWIEEDVLSFANGSTTTDPLLDNALFPRHLRLKLTGQVLQVAMDMQLDATAK